MITPFAKLFAIIGSFPGKVKNFFNKKGGANRPPNTENNIGQWQALKIGVPCRYRNNGWENYGVGRLPLRDDRKKQQA
jgi:hypothetical protein